MLNRYLAVLDAARLLGVTPETVRRWISTGKLPAVRLAGGREYRIFHADLMLLLEPVTARSRA